MFTDKEHRGPFAFSEELANLSIGAESVEDIVSAQRVEANDKDLLLSTSEKEESGGTNSYGSAYSAPAYDNSMPYIAASLTQSELLSLDQRMPANAPQTSSPIDDLFGLGLSVAPIPTPAPSPPPLKLSPKAVLDPNTFQQKWRQLPVSIQQVHFHKLSLLRFSDYAPYDSIFSFTL